MSSCVGLVYFQSLLLTWTKTTASGLSYELGVNGGKKWKLRQMDIAHFTTLVNLEILTF